MCHEEYVLSNHTPCGRIQPWCPPPPLLCRRHKISTEAAPAIMARLGQSHALDPGADSRSAGFLPPITPFRAGVEARNYICRRHRFSTKPLS